MVQGDFHGYRFGVLSKRKEHFYTTILHLRQQFQNDEALSCKSWLSALVVHTKVSV